MTKWEMVAITLITADVLRDTKSVLHRLANCMRLEISKDIRMFIGLEWSKTKKPKNAVTVKPRKNRKRITMENINQNGSWCQKL